MKVHCDVLVLPRALACPLLRRLTEGWNICHAIIMLPMNVMTMCVDNMA